MKTKKVIKGLPVPLTGPEMDIFRDELADCIKKRTDVVDQKAEATKKHNEVIKAIDERIEYCTERIISRSQNKSVECHWEYNPLSRKMELYRDDTNEKVESRDLTEAEMQLEASFCDQFEDKEEAPAGII